MLRFSFSSLRARLLLLVLLAVIPALGLILYTGLEQRRLEAAKVREDAVRVLRYSMMQLELLIAGARQVLVTLAQLPEVRSGNPAACRALFATLDKQYPLFVNFGAIKPNGDLLCSAVPFHGSIKLTDRAYLRRAVETRDFSIREYQISRATGKATVSFGYPVFNEAGHFQAVVFLALDLAWLNNLTAEAQLPQGSTLTVIDRNGTILARYLDPEKWIGKSMPEAPLFKAIQVKKGEGTVEASGLDGVPRLFAFTSMHASAGSEVTCAVGIPTEVAFAETNRMLTRNLAGLGIVAVLALVAAWLGGDQLILRRVNTLMSATKRLADGDLDARMGPPYWAGELGHLARAFDDMATTLQAREAERKRLEEETRHRQRLEDILRFKSEFIANMSHELRTPLNSVLGFAELLEDQKFGPLTEKQQRYVHNIWTSGKHLLDLINDILDLSKVEAGKIDLELETFSLTEALEDALTMVKPQAVKKQISLGSEIASEITTITADPLRFKQIMFNLLSNAIKFTPEGGSVTVKAMLADELPGQAPAAVQIAVSDTGIGISPEDQLKLFREFSQVGGEYARRQQGTGLGLALSKKIVELHGGTIWADSRGEGKGSTFTFTLPLQGPV